METVCNSTTPPVSPPRLIIEVADESLGRLGYIAIDRPVDGAASGGVRFAPDVSVDEVTSLARSMTYKWAFLNVPMGGAKAGIFANPQQLGCDKVTLMERFGRAIGPLVRQQVYYPGIDMGTTLEDLRAIMRGAGRPLVGRQIDGSFCTGLTVFETIRQVASSSNLELTGLRVAIEGFGKVASTVAELLTQAGARLIALSTAEGAIIAEGGLDMLQLLSLKQQHGDRLVHYYPKAQLVELNALFTQPVNLLIPGARPGVIYSGNADQIQARWIVPISNAPVTTEAEQMLVTRGIMVIPGFISNCGGVLASNMLSNGFDVKDVQWLVETTFVEVVTKILETAHQEGRSVGEIARTLAWQNYLELNESAALSVNKATRASRVLKDQGLIGVWRRFAWRAHHRWPRLNGAIRRAAVEQFAEWGLGITLSRLASPAPRVRPDSSLHEVVGK